MASPKLIDELLASLGPAARADRGEQWAEQCAHVLGLDGVAITMDAELVFFSDRTSARLEDVQYVLGHGPGVPLRPEMELRQVPDVQKIHNGAWPKFAAEAQTLGVAALFVWPVRIGAVAVGTLTGYRRAPGPLEGRQAADGWLIADVLAAHILAHLPTAASAAADGPGTAGAVDMHRAEVHQATGVLSVRLEIPLAQALARLRARAYTEGRPLTATAHDILKELPS
ncbi:ANTAR domain-containing protein [Streptomyces chrestomyceticus]|uniref:ANTAR domain-containing protein n=1 Tax=Streptomyces chrestomyceticus TaxID=68185 RepID=A0ABU7X4B9_9ACTN